MARTKRKAIDEPERKTYGEKSVQVLNEMKDQADAERALKKKKKKTKKKRTTGKGEKKSSSTKKKKRSEGESPRKSKSSKRRKTQDGDDSKMEKKKKYMSRNSDRLWDADTRKYVRVHRNKRLVGASRYRKIMHECLTDPFLIRAEKANEMRIGKGVVDMVQNYVEEKYVKLIERFVPKTTRLGKNRGTVMKRDVQFFMETDKEENPNAYFINNDVMDSFLNRYKHKIVSGNAS